MDFLRTTHGGLSLQLTPIVLVRRELMGNAGVYLTSVELAARTGLSRVQVSTALHCLRKQRNVTRRVETRHGGRNTGQAYTWRDGGACPNCGRLKDDVRDHRAFVEAGCPPAKGGAS